MFLLEVKLPDTTELSELLINPETIVFMQAFMHKKEGMIHSIQLSSGMSFVVTEKTYQQVKDFAEPVLVGHVPSAFHTAWAKEEEDDEDLDN